MQAFLLVLILTGCALAAYRWIWGFLAVIVIGLLQDPVRKMIPEAPGIYAMATVPVWIFMLARGLFSNELVPRRFLNAFPRLARWLTLFAFYLIIPVAISLTYGEGTWQITLLGLLIYSMAILTLFAGFAVVHRDEVRTLFLAFYAVTAGLSLVGGPLEYLLGGDLHAAIGTISLGATWVTHRTGEAVFMMAGFFRGPDIMGWHASLVFMISVIMAIRHRGATRIAWIGLAIWAFVSMWVCGRRKIIFMIPVFAGSYTFLFYYFRGVRKLVSTVGLLIMITGLASYVISAYVWQTEVYDFYMTTFSEAGEQFKRHGYESVLGTFEQSGFWGYGLGMAQQGVHHIKADKPNLWQESGPTKIMVELGIPGTFMFVVIFVLLFMTAMDLMRLRARETDFIISAGIMSVLFSNLVAAIISAQIYTDPFIAFMLASMTGMLLGSVHFKSGGAES